MKSIFLLIFMMGTIQLFAQNYSLIDTSKSYHFQNDNFEIHSIKIDAVAITGTDTFFFNHKSPYRDPFNFNCVWIIQDSSWIGQAIIAKNNGEYIFSNAKSDSIYIHPQAPLNSSWILFNLPNGAYIEATISTIDTQSVLGIVDSVKTIALQAKDGTNTNIAHAMNGLEILISEHYGFVQLFSFYAFPEDSSYYQLVGLENPNLGYENLKPRDIFNYNVGDEIHSEENHFSYAAGLNIRNSKKKIRVLGKSLLAPNNDAYIYEYEWCEKKEGYFGGPYSTIHVMDTLLDTIYFASSPNLNHFTGVPFANEKGFLNQSIDTSLYNRRSKAVYDGFYSYTWDCYGNFYGNPGRLNIYIEGLGGPYYFYKNHHDSMTNNLVYYAKGNETWGTPITLDCERPDAISTVIAPISQLHLFPNPTNSQITVSSEKEMTGVIEIKNINGQHCLSKSVEFEHEVLLNIQDLPSGVYILHYRDEKTGILHVNKLMKEG